MDRRGIGSGPRTLDLAKSCASDRSNSELRAKFRSTEHRAVRELASRSVSCWELPPVAHTSTHTVFGQVLLLYTKTSAPDTNPHAHIVAIMRVA